MIELRSGDQAQAIGYQAEFVLREDTCDVGALVLGKRVSWALGMGERFNPDALETMEVGTYGLVAGKMAHFGFSRTEADRPGPRNWSVYDDLDHALVCAYRSGRVVVNLGS